MDQFDEKALDNAVQSLLGQVAMDSPIVKYIQNTEGHPAQILLPVLFTMGHVIEILARQVGILDARLQAIDGED
jgi:hypothetical protein